MDDVGVVLDDGGFVLVQAKRGLRLDPRLPDLRAAVEQLVNAFVHGLRTRVEVRAVDDGRDRLVLVTDTSGSQAFSMLGRVLDRFRGLPAELPVADAARTAEEVSAWERFRGVVVAVWTTVAGSAPEERELRGFLRVVEVQRLDLETGSGTDRVRAVAWLEQADARDAAFEVLTECGVRAARDRSWFQRHQLQERAGIPVGVERGYPNQPRGQVSMRWLRERLDAAIEDLGPRYNRQLTVDVPPAAVMAGFARRREALTPLHEELDASRRALLKAAEIDESAPLPGLITELECLCAEVEASESSGALPVDSWRNRSAALLASAQEVTKGYPSYQREHDVFGRPLASYQQGLKRARAWLDGQVPAAWNERVVLVEGEQGRGKSHLLADTARTAMDDGQPVLLLLGQHFLSPTEPWSQAIANLQWPGTADELLTALNTLAVGAGRRALLMIDALNEGEGRSIWPRWLAGLLSQVSQYEHIGVVLSVRTIAVPVCVPEAVVASVTRVEHTGFADVEFNAVREFFAHYRLVEPATPLLLPEFREPLFLELFCRTAQQRPDLMGTAPGLSAVLDGFLTTRDTIVSDRLDLDPSDKVVTKACRALARAMADRGRRWLGKEEATRITQGVCPTFGGYSRSLYAALLTERVLINSFVHSREGTAEQNPIQFSYERLADHLIATNLIADAHTARGYDRDRLTDAIAQLQPRDTTFDALALLLPELTGLELTDLAPPRTRQALERRVIRSLPLRVPTAITDTATALLTNHLLEVDHRETSIAAETALSLACRPGHRLDHAWLHATLASMPMWRRDMTWSAATSYPAVRRSSRRNPYSRLLRWIAAESAASIANLTDEVALAVSTTLMWAFTNSDRFLRDTATRRLVKVAEVHPKVMVPLLHRAAEVDDLYVLERVCAAIYGVALRKLPDDSLRQVADAVLSTVFGEDGPPAHILIRDYAHNLVRLAYARGLVTDDDVARTTGPWPSRWPEDEIPSQEELEQRFPLFAEGEPSRDKSLWASIHLSAGEDGDFGRYIIGTNAPLSFPFASNSANSDHEDDEDDEDEQHPGKLAQMAAALPDDDPLRESLDDLLAAAKATAERPIRRRRKPVDPDVVTRYVICGVAERGWTPERFRDIDRDLDATHREGRGSHKRERIGKKYQWQAWHQALALLADTHQPNEDRTYERVSPTGSIAARDIDPTHQLTGNPEDPSTDQYSPAPTWWMPYTRPAQPDLTTFDAQRTWVSDHTQLIDTSDLIIVPGTSVSASPAGTAHSLGSGIDWILLRGSASWYWDADGPAPRLSSKGVWADHGLVHHTVVIRQNDIPAILAAPLTKYHPHDYRHDFTDSAFLGEFPHQAPFLDILAERDTAEGWTTDTSIPAPVLHATDRYVWEGSIYDCSLTGTVSVTLPSAHLLHLIAPHARTLDNTIRQPDGTIIAFAPDTHEPGDSALLVHADLLHTGLTEANLALGRLIYQERRSAEAHKHNPWPGMTTRTSLHIHTPTPEGWTTHNPIHHDVNHPARTGHD